MKIALRRAALTAAALALVVVVLLCDAAGCLADRLGRVAFLLGLRVDAALGGLRRGR